MCMWVSSGGPGPGARPLTRRSEPIASGAAVIERIRVGCERSTAGCDGSRTSVRNMQRFASWAAITLGAILFVAALVSGPDVGPAIVGLAAIVVGVMLRVSAPRPSTPLGTAGVSAPSIPGGVPSVGGVPAPMAGPGQLMGRRIDGTFSAEEIVARGVAVQGRLRSAAMTGRTAGEIAPQLPREQAADPIVQVEFEYSVDPRVNLVKEAYVRVPAGVVHRLAPGVEIPVRVIAEQPEIAAIDWSRF